MQYNNFCLTLNSRARAARACFLRQSSQKCKAVLSRQACVQTSRVPEGQYPLRSYRGARRRIRARPALKTMQYNNFCLTLNSRARAARACFLRQPSQKMRSSFELTGLRADEPRPRRSIPSYRGAKRRIRARRTLKTMQYNNFCLTLNSRARAARACFLRRTSQKMRSSFEQTGLRADEPRPRRSIPLRSYRGARRRIRARRTLKTMHKPLERGTLKL